jgi:hypothetical protein
MILLNWYANYLWARIIPAPYNKLLHRPSLCGSKVTIVMNPSDMISLFYKDTWKKLYKYFYIMYTPS